LNAHLPNSAFKAHDGGVREVLAYLRTKPHATVVGLAHALAPQCFAEPRIAEREQLIDQISHYCARMAALGVLGSAYSSEDGDLYYFIPEVHIAPSRADGHDAPRVERHGLAPQTASKPEISRTDPNIQYDPARTRFAIFFRFGGLVLRDACLPVLRHLGVAARRAEDLEIIGLVSHRTGDRDLKDLNHRLAHGRARVVADRLIDMGVDPNRMRVDYAETLHPQRISSDVFTATRPENGAALAHRVDIRLRIIGGPT
jgi:outer membrane protein OmpA-like peptidoglycan-associated protein